MKRSELKAKAEELGATLTDEMLDFIMQSNGADINNAKSEGEALNKKIEELTKVNESLTSKVDQFKDYDELVKFKEDALAKGVVDAKTDFLKGKGVKFPDLIIDKIDWSKLNYNEESKTFEGENVDAAFNQLKEQYGEALFNTEEKTPQVTLKPSDDSSKYDDVDGVERILMGRFPKIYNN